MEHQWFTAQFNYGGWTLCKCGYRPFSEADFHKHSEEFSIKA